MALAGVLIAAAFAQPVPTWQAGVAASYVWGRSYDGPGLTVQATWAPTEWFALGPVVDVTHVGSNSLASANGFPATFSFTSTIAAGLFEFRWPLPYVEPYTDLAVGYVAVTQQRRQNVQCAVESGPGGFLAAGARTSIGNQMSVGVRGSVRLPSSFWGDCPLTLGPADVDVGLLFTAGGTLDFRW